ncbi:hypothetical protein L3X38_037958 [Prunus dulcis]|uniref:AMP-activated protein kinase glycogen-binding domain-containing protein n=1 Tax=Prunus dulcis TaxID=3755 RepID=A0AAD4YR35_PRUDU|nr:hypothetical protein L3X38_037958 [Prunus dulcis]
MDKAHPLSTPMVVRSLDTKKDPYRPKGDDEMVLGPEVPYLSAIGALLYLAQCTRPDISFSVNLLARYSSAPTWRHWTGIKHVLRYLRGTTDMGLFYSSELTNAQSIIGYADAGYLSDPHQGRSQTGYVFTCGGTAISWRSTKQTLVATSSNHSEILALHEASRECVWLRSVIHHIRSTCALPSTTDTPTILNEDNAACIAQITGGYIKGDMTKHISPKFFYTHELQKSQEIKVRQIRSSDNLADLFTKSLPKYTFQKLVHGIGLRQLCKQSSWSMQNQGEHSRVLFLRIDFPTGFFKQDRVCLSRVNSDLLFITVHLAALIEFVYHGAANHNLSEEPINMEIGTVRCSLDNQVLWLSRESSRKLDWRNVHPLPHIVTTWKLKVGYQRLIDCQVSTGKHSLNHVFWRRHSIHTSLEESSSVQGETYSGNDEYAHKDSQENHLSQPLRSNELKSLLADSERTKLIKKLSEANQQNRFLKRQLHIKEDSLVNFKSELAVLELEIQALVKLAEENTKSVIPQGSRKINGKYIQSHLLSRLEAVHEKLKEQIKDVDAVQSKEVPLFWYGMAESVQVMGTFDGWSQGEHLSSEYTGSFTTFSTTLMLRPGRYEIKFLVDGEWKLSPEFPTVGEGLMKNNLLIVE